MSICTLIFAMSSTRHAQVCRCEADYKSQIAVLLHVTPAAWPIQALNSQNWPAQLKLDVQVEAMKSVITHVKICRRCKTAIDCNLLPYVHRNEMCINHPAAMTLLGLVQYHHHSTAIG